MKLFNELKAESTGIVRGIHVDNAQPVEFGQLLFELEPVGDAPLDAHLMFSRVLVANRGEVAVRVIRALHELDVEAVAVYSTADEGATYVRMADRAVRLGPPAAVDSYLRIPSVVAAAQTTGCDAVHPGWGFLAENPAFAPRVRGQRPRLRRPDAGRDGADGRQGAGQAGDARRRRAARAGNRRDGHDRAGARVGARARLSRAAEGGGRRRRQGNAARPFGRGARRRVRRRGLGGAGGVRRPVALRREGGEAGAPRGDPGARRRARERAHARRARVLDSAPPPEADRGVAVARAHARRARGDGGRRRAGRARDRLPQRGHVRVPRRARRLLLLHRAERTAAGRASRVRGLHGDRHRAGAVADRCR